MKEKTNIHMCMGVLVRRSTKHNAEMQEEINK